MPVAAISFGRQLHPKDVGSLHVPALNLCRQQRPKDVRPRCCDQSLNPSPHYGDKIDDKNIGKKSHQSSVSVLIRFDVHMSPPGPNVKKSLLSTQKDELLLTKCE